MAKFSTLAFVGCIVLYVVYVLISYHRIGFHLTRLSFSLWTLRSKSPYLDFSVNVSIHIRTKDLVARGFKIIQLLRADI